VPVTEEVALARVPRSPDLPSLDASFSPFLWAGQTLPFALPLYQEFRKLSQPSRRTNEQGTGSKLFNDYLVSGYLVGTPKISRFSPENPPFSAPPMGFAWAVMYLQWGPNSWSDFVGHSPE